MKLIQGMKLIKELQLKAQDIRQKIVNHSAHLSVETPVYEDQKGQVSKWLQAHEDLIKEVGSLMRRVTKTNLETSVTITIADKPVTKTITEWIIRRRLTAKFDQQAWESLTDRNLKEGQIQPSQPGGTATPVKIIRCYSPEERDGKVSTYRWEPGEIDRILETVNAVTDLLD